MSAFVPLLVKELRFWFRRPGVHLFALLFLAFGVLTIGSIAGDIEFVNVGGAGGLAKADSPVMLVNLSLVLCLFTTMNLAAAAGGAATRDVTTGMHPLVYSTPIGKPTLLGTRFLGAMLVGAYVYYALPVGMLLGRMLLPGLEAERIGAFAPGATLLAFTAWGLPNLLLTISLFFAIGTTTRRMFPIYIGGVFLFVGYLGSSAFVSDLDNRVIGVLIDPFGASALDDLTRYWTPAEKNSLVPWPTGMALVNRALWSAVGVFSLALGYLGTRLDQFGWQPFSRFRRGAPSVEAEEGTERSTVPKVARTFSTGTRLTQLLALTRRAFRDVLGHRYFWAFVGAAVLFELLNAQAVGTMYGTDTWPTTYQVLEIFEGTLGIFLLVIVTFYAGDLVWAERDLGQAQLLDSSPLPDWLPLVAKTLALTAVVIGMHTTILVIGPLVQLASGYTNFEFGLYLQALFGLSLLDWLPYIVLAIALHALVNHKVVGHVVLVGIFMGVLFRTSWGFEFSLPWFGSDPGRTYSDMNGWGHSLGPYLWYKAYWLAFSLVLFGLARLAWVRGTDGGLRARLTEARRRLDTPTWAVLGAGGLLTGGLAAFLFVQTYVVGGYEHSTVEKRAAATYERTYRDAWLRAPHPVVTAVDATIDLFPDEGTAHVEATFELVNPHDVPIERLLLSFPNDDLLESYAFAGGSTETVDDFSVHTVTLATPLAPGARTTLTFRTRHGHPGIPNRGFETTVVSNGTFLHHNDVFPVFGYEPGYEHSDPADRRTYELPERDRMLDLDDPNARLQNYITDDGHRIDMSLRVSTVKGQTLLAPGRVVEQGEEDGRVWSRFEIDDVVYFLAVLSGEYEVRRSENTRIPMEVYFHPGHDYNVDRMLQGMEASLTMFERDFGPYDHDVLRIVEFPRYATYAQAFPTLVPFSESIGFIAMLTDPEEDIDYPYYVTAHEVAHQWWAHQIIGGNGQGATVLTESLAQYSSLKVMEQEYGKQKIAMFLEHESDRYFRGRSNERDREVPLMRVENQPYIHYQKGGSMLYALSERIGRARFDGAIRAFLQEWKHRGPPYPTARDFVAHLKASFPGHEEALVDAFERIVIYDLRLTSATAEPVDGAWRLRLDVVASKQVADEEGHQVEEPFSDRVSLEVVDVDGGTHLEHVRVDGSGVVTARTDYEPAKVVLDGLVLFPDRDRDDNEARVGG